MKQARGNRSSTKAKSSRHTYHNWKQLDPNISLTVQTFTYLYFLIFPGIRDMLCDNWMDFHEATSPIRLVADPVSAGLRKISQRP